MKGLKTVAIVAGVALTGTGVVLAMTNPEQAAYEAFATPTLIAYLEKNVCVEAPFGLQESCKVLLKTNQSQIREFISRKTRQQNFIFFSIYTTDLSIGFGLPSYRVETIGVFQQFYIYRAERS